MKKYILILLALLQICVLACGCGEAAGTDSQEKTNITDGSNLISAQPGNEDKTQQKPPEPEKIEVDVDLTTMGSIMVYAEVTNILSNPKYYMDKTIRISGIIYNSYFEETDKYYQFVIVGDSTACCQQGMEFVWKGDHIYPDDYPEDNTPIEVVGVYKRYEELGIEYNYLEVDEITVLS